MLLDRALGEDERLGDRRVALALGDLGEDLALARGQLVERRALDARLAATSASTIFGSITEPPAATASIAATQLARGRGRAP